MKHYLGKGNRKDEVKPGYRTKRVGTLIPIIER